MVAELIFKIYMNYYFYNKNFNCSGSCSNVPLELLKNIKIENRRVGYILQHFEKCMTFCFIFRFDAI